MQIAEMENNLCGWEHDKYSCTWKQICVQCVHQKICVQCMDKSVLLDKLGRTKEIFYTCYPGRSQSDFYTYLVFQFLNILPSHQDPAKKDFRPLDFFSSRPIAFWASFGRDRTCKSKCWRWITRRSWLTLTQLDIYSQSTLISSKYVPELVNFFTFVTDLPFPN